MRCSMQDIFNAHFDSYAKQRSLHPRESRAAWCIRHCGDGAFGTQTLACPEGHFEVDQHCACRHRSCPRCSGRPRQLWIDSQLARLLPCPHFHVVFTLPHVLLPLWSFNRAAMAALLFDCVRDSLLQLMADPKRMGVRPGLLMALHTWGRNLSQHPHIHCLLSAGGIDQQGQWKPGCAGFLLPLKPLQLLFRGKLLARLKTVLIAQHLRLPTEQGLPVWLATIRQLYAKHWNIEIQPPYGHARGVALYLARYVKGGPVPQDRTLQLDAKGLVRMGYTDHRDGCAKTLCLHAHEFIERVLWHSPPKGLHTVRYGGLYSSALPTQYHAAIAALASASQPASQPASRPALQPCAAKNQPALAPTCPTCQRPLLTRFCRSTHQNRENSFNSQRTSQPSPAHHQRAPRPNHSFKPTPDGMPRWASSAGPPAHSALAAQRGIPSSAT